MLRTVLQWFDKNRRLPHALGFLDESIWYSEALLGSRFFGHRRGDSRAEGWTNADAVIGHFRLRAGERGDIELLPNARQLVVIEAKLASGLAAGVKNARQFNQAARNVACIAHLLERCGQDPGRFDRLAFIVLAPDSRIGSFKAALDLEGSLGIRETVAERVRSFSPEHDDWHANSFASTLAKLDIQAISWESVIDHIRSADQTFGQELLRFYGLCKQFNRLEI
jgi:hypothetical protein